MFLSSTQLTTRCTMSTLLTKGQVVLCVVIAKKNITHGASGGRHRNRL